MLRNPLRRVFFRPDTLRRACLPALRSGFGLAAGYGLSKRTTAYAGLRTNKTKVGDTTTGKGSLFAVGLRHTF